MDTKKPPQQDITVENQQINNQSKIEINLTQNYYITDRKFEGHTTTKHNSRNEEYKTANRTRRKTHTTSRNDRYNN